MCKASLGGPLLTNSSPAPSTAMRSKGVRGGGCTPKGKPVAGALGPVGEAACGAQRQLVGVREPLLDYFGPSGCRNPPQKNTTDFRANPQGLGGGLGSNQQTSLGHGSWELGEVVWDSIEPISKWGAWMEWTK
jgi:hypothetical protein